MEFSFQYTHNICDKDTCVMMAGCVTFKGAICEKILIPNTKS